MQDQLISNWDNLYQNGNNPQWEDLEPNQEFLSLVHAFIKPEMKVLEIGSGLGHNALELAKKEVDITASDVRALQWNAVKKWRKNLDLN